jgi:uncharacterized damage-inducible protein DinB
VGYSDAILPEFDAEMASTRKVLERIPDDKFGWQPHPKSHTIGWNANHLADMPGWLPATLTTTAWDISPPGGEMYKSPSLTTTVEVLELFDRNVATARKLLEAATDEEVAKDWSLLKGGETVFTMPRSVMVRRFVLNHVIHHRAILCVYLRLNDIPVPGMYGPSGDE